MDQGHKLLFMVLQAINITLSKKPTQLPTVWKFSSRHMICVTIRRVEARVQALLETVDTSPPQRIMPCDIKKLINSLKLRKACELMAFQMNVSGTFQGDHWFT
jgi:hypothetical protein